MRLRLKGATQGVVRSDLIGTAASESIAGFHLWLSETTHAVTKMQDDELEQLFDKLFPTRTTFLEGARRETHRGWALMAAQFLHTLLHELLTRSLVPSGITRDFIKKLDFEERINLGFMLGRYDGRIQRDLDLIRRIRNRFAHSTEALDFDSDGIRDICRELTLPIFPRDVEPARRFFHSFNTVAYYLEIAIQRASAPKVDVESVQMPTVTPEQLAQAINWLRDMVRNGQLDETSFQNPEL